MKLSHYLVLVSFLYTLEEGGFFWRAAKDESLIEKSKNYHCTLYEYILAQDDILHLVFDR